MTSRKVQRYHQRVKDMTSKQSRLSNSSTQRSDYDSDYDEEVCWSSRSGKPLVILIALVVAFWAGVLIWAVRGIF